jgi:phage-related minor tail protein
MERHEIKARVDAKLDEWKSNLDVMKAKSGAKTGDANAKYHEHLSELQSQYDDLKVHAAKTWDTADDKFDDASKALELKWAEWEVRAKHALDDVSK